MEVVKVLLEANVDLEAKNGVCIFDVIFLVVKKRTKESNISNTK